MDKPPHCDKVSSIKGVLLVYPVLSVDEISLKMLPKVSIMVILTFSKFLGVFREFSWNNDKKSQFSNFYNVTIGHLFIECVLFCSFFLVDFLV